MSNKWKKLDLEKKLLFLLLLTTFLKELVFSFAVPIWHGPDEQAHFGQVAYFGEFGAMPNGEKTTTREIFESEKLLGTLRDARGNNLFTFHPEYKIEYTNSETGKFEHQINNFSKEYHKELTIREASTYPPLFYYVSALPYLLFYSAGLITRIFLVRLISILCLVATVYVAFLCGKKIFPKSSLAQISLAILVSFHPMLSFLGATVNSDNLMNLMFSLIIYFGLKIVDEGLNSKTTGFVALITISGFFTKSQFVVALPLIIIALAICIVRYKHKMLSKKNLVIWAIVSLGAVISAWFVIGPILNSFHKSDNSEYSVLAFFRGALLQTYREALPWYWGVYDWLGVTYPRIVHRIINFTLLVAVLGLIKKIYLLLIKDKDNLQLLNILFLIFCSVTYYLSIIYFDYLYYQSTGGVGVGIQGRYFFPTIVAHLALVLIGFIAILPAKLKKVEDVWIKILVLGMVVLNMIALLTIFTIYYEFTNVLNFLLQMSQYKPLFYKYPANLFLTIFYLLSLVTFLKYFLRMEPNDK